MMGVWCATLSGPCGGGPAGEGTRELPELADPSLARAPELDGMPARERCPVGERVQPRSWQNTTSRAGRAGEHAPGAALACKGS